MAMHWVNKTSLAFAILLVIVYSSLWLLNRKNPEDGPGLFSTAVDGYAPTQNEFTEGVNKFKGSVNTNKPSPPDEKGLELEVDGEIALDQKVSRQQKMLTHMETRIDNTIRTIERLEIDYNRRPNDATDSELNNYNQQLEQLEQEYSSLSESLN